MEFRHGLHGLRCCFIQSYFQNPCNPCNLCLKMIEIQPDLFCQFLIELTLFIVSLFIVQSRLYSLCLRFPDDSANLL